MKISQKGFISPLLLALIALLLIGGGAYVYVHTKPASQSAMTQTSDWKTLTNTQYGFSLKYPDINARLKSIGSWTDANEPIITSRTPFNYNECASSGKGPGMSASSVTIADRKYCLVIVYAVEPSTFSYQYEYISRIGNEDIGIIFSFSGNNGVSGHQVEIVEEAPLFFIQILSTLTLTTRATSTAQTPDWKTYKDNVIGIQFQYPSTWQPPHTGGEYTDINPYVISMGIFNISVSTTTTGRIGPSGIKNIAVGGEKGIKTSSLGGEEMFAGAQYIFIPLSNRAIRIAYADNGPEMNKIYEQIINTIIFVTQ